MAEESGTIEEGKVADVIAVRGDPLAQPELLADADNVRVVVQAGRVVKSMDVA